MAVGGGFDDCFRELTGWKPLGWQRRLFHRHFERGELPAALDIPTGLGKTSVMALWLIARAQGASLPRRLAYVVDRRVVVDQATAEAEKLREALEADAKHLKGPSGTRRAQASHLHAARRACRQPRMARRPRSARDHRRHSRHDRLAASVRGLWRVAQDAALSGGPARRRYSDRARRGPSCSAFRASAARDRTESGSPIAGERLPRTSCRTSRSCRCRRRSATGANDAGEHAPFRLEEDDWKADHVAKMRLEAKKRLRLRPFAEKDHDRQLAEAAWALAAKDGNFFRVVVFCDRRDKRKLAWGRVRRASLKRSKTWRAATRKLGAPSLEIHPVELLVGARRVHERDKVEQSLRELGFIGQKGRLEMPVFLVAPAAGEVGVDIDADHMVSDLVAWERMVQRLGRVNRRGEGDAKITVFWSEASVKDADAPSESEKRGLIALASKAVIENLSQIEGAHDASPGALRRLAESARSDRVLKALIDGATTPEPLRPALNRALVDAWSMTSLETHTGRPDVAPWLRGWVDEEPQTTIIWRRHLPVRVDAGGRTLVPPKAEIEDFFEAAPPHESEKLETETSRVASWLQARAKILHRPPAPCAARTTKPKRPLPTTSTSKVRKGGRMRGKQGICGATTLSR